MISELPVGGASLKARIRAASKLERMAHKLALDGDIENYMEARLVSFIRLSLECDGLLEPEQADQPETRGKIIKFPGVA
jgi:hypothetical protein